MLLKMYNLQITKNYNNELTFCSICSDSESSNMYSSILTNNLQLATFLRYFASTFVRMRPRYHSYLWNGFPKMLTKSSELS